MGFSCIISQANIWHEKSFLFIMCREALLSKDEMSAHKGWHMTSANNEMNTLQSIVLVSDMVLGLLPIECIWVQHGQLWDKCTY